VSSPKQIPIGTRSGRLTTISEVRLKAGTNGPWSHGVVMCRCDCGAEPVEVRANSLRTGNTTSCGCKRKEANASRTKTFPAGKPFGRLVTIGEVHKDAGGKPCVLVRCDCGRSEPFLIRTSALLRPTRPTRSCGCAHLSDVPIGTTFGHQVTVSLPRSESRDDGKPNEVLVDVRCACGSIRPVLVKNLIQGESMSCGCVKDHFAYRGLSKQYPDLYKCWTNMRERCLNPRNVNYRFYGGKGVTICGEWRDARTGFPAFVAWATGHGYEPGLQIDRIDPDRNYEPGNCRWLTARENILRAGRILDDEDEHRMTALRARTGQSVADIIELALDAFLPPLEGTPADVSF